MTDTATPSTSPSSLTPSWLTVASFSLLFSVISGVSGASVSYGKQETANANLVQRVADYKEVNTQLIAKIERWSQAYDAQGAKLKSAQLRVSELENDRCNPVKEDIDRIRYDIELAETSHRPDQEIERTIRLMNDYQQSLRACYASTGRS